MFVKTSSSGRPSKTTPYVKCVVEDQMRLKNYTTAYQLHSLLNANGYFLSIHTVFQCRSDWGWTFRDSAYCQLIRQVNKKKCLQCAQEYKDDMFADVIYTNECTVQLESHRWFFCWKEDEAPCPNHGQNVQVWAGISLWGSTGICNFYGIKTEPYTVYFHFTVNSVAIHTYTVRMLWLLPKLVSNYCSIVFKSNHLQQQTIMLTFLCID